MQFFRENVWREEKKDRREEEDEVLRIISIPILQQLFVLAPLSCHKCLSLFFFPPSWL